MKHLLNLFYPDLCHSCGLSLVRGEHSICVQCIDHLPRTSFHTDRENLVEKVFWGKVELEGATAFTYFNKGGMMQKLLHELKYKGARQVGSRLGELLGAELLNAPTFKQVDIVIPVPLHPKKKRKRGFNQAEMIALGICSSIERPIETNALIRIQHTATQTQRSRFDRWDNVGDVFKVKAPKKIEGKRILLVDDVLTTGATIGSCANILLEHTGTKVCIATLATA